ncbi:hypothetical protein [Spartinivicinus poritis]|uniref:Uncharacterized protein n=1 Tax=Spartinivicinus poritis TaxID=2994640 RepID=A0ABT5U5V5_9GAMM|nr:hypothetical protein [Spartinivicinus sp. A2-2]MDE1461734.1 hypothetical protein [Spartinivicinus sp. A2-2]
MKKLTLIILLLSLISSFTLAAGFTKPQKITRVEVLQNNVIMIEAENAFDNPGCSSSKIAVLKDETTKNSMLTLVLTAYSTGQKVGGYFSGCWTTLWNNQETYPAFHQLYITK